MNSHQKVLVSHSTEDSKVAASLSDLIAKCSLRQIIAWYSSDNTGVGGVLAGDRWLDRIRTELKNSRAVIVLLTPQSLDSAWVHFEAGYGAANGDLEIIPVVAGVTDFSEIPNPLTHWQMFRVDRPDACSRFLEKLFSRLEVHFDHDVVKDPVARFSANIENIINRKDKEKIPEEGAIDYFNTLRNYLDSKFFDLSSRISKEETNFSGYKFTIEGSVDCNSIDIMVDMQTTFQDILDEVYFQLDNNVEAFSYLKQWILRDKLSGQRFIIREVAGDVPARALLWPGRKVVVERLEQPYNGEDDGLVRYHRDVAAGLIDQQSNDET